MTQALARTLACPQGNNYQGNTEHVQGARDHAKGSACHSLIAIPACNIGAPYCYPHFTDVGIEILRFYWPHKITSKEFHLFILLGKLCIIRFIYFS